MELHIEKFEQDIIKEAINIGAGSAVTTLSKMVNGKVSQPVPEAELKTVEQAYTLFGDSKLVSTAILLKITGDISGVMMILLTAADAIKFAGLLQPDRQKNLNLLDEMDRSSLREAGNMIAGSTLGALSKFLGLSAVQSLPDVATDMTGAIANAVLGEVAVQSEQTLVVQSGFTVDDKAVAGKFYFLFTPEASQKIIDGAKKMISPS